MRCRRGDGAGRDVLARACELELDVELPQSRGVGLANAQLFERRARSARSSRIVTSSFDSRARAACSSSASRGRFFVILSARARIASSDPNSVTSSRAVLSPMPFTPGTLSDESPTSAR